MQLRPKGHQKYTITYSEAGRLVHAKCECGWESKGLSGGGLAGTAWDVHVSEQ